MFIKDIYKRGVNFSRELAITALCVLGSVLIGCYLGVQFYSTLENLLIERELTSFAITLFQAFFLLIFLYGNFVYILARFGYLKRLQSHKPASWDQLTQHFNEECPKVTILVPSYKEELSVIRQTLLSAALQLYPNRSVTLLIDDPSFPTNAEDKASLQRTKDLVCELEEDLQNAGSPFRLAREHFELRKKEGKLDLAVETQTLSSLHLHVAEWMQNRIVQETAENHVDQAFHELVYQQRAQFHLERSRTPFSSIDQCEKEYALLASLFEVSINYFERKRYVNLSHAPNKAMNLNSYIGLLGGHFREVESEKGLMLLKTDPQNADFHVPNTPFVAMLDADSLISFDYAIRLIHEMHAKGNEKLAVIQTPYSAFQNSPGECERIAGATTDMQYIVHQGFSYFNAAYWVGANAVIRKEALDAIRETDQERGFIIDRFIQDRTVIEDTESTVDLIDRGWKIYNYPERLSYSATPPDFGSLLIQRRRWANGGLLIAPKLLRYLFNGKAIKWGMEGFMRFHYLVSIPMMMVGFFFLLLFPLEQSIRSLVILLMAPYFALYARDLHLTGYRYSDLFRVLALNWFLVPVNLGGVLKSLQQAVTGMHIPFCRTPKVAGRTTVPKLYVVLECILLLYAGSGIYDMFINPSLINILANSFFSSIAFFAFFSFLGVKHAMKDIFPNKNEMVIENKRMPALCNETA